MSLTQEAFDRIRDAIVSGRLEFGEALSETQIATALDMSKAPVRAAFMALSDRGLVNIVPQSGTYVFTPTVDDVRQLSHFRALLEDEAIREAYRLNRSATIKRLDVQIVAMERARTADDWEIYRKADSAYHLVFMGASENRYLLKAYALSALALEALRVRLQGGGTGNFRQRSFEEHIEIVEHLRAGRLDEARDLLRLHILIINESVHLMPLIANKAQRKDQNGARNYAEIFPAPQGPR